MEGSDNIFCVSQISRELLWRLHAARVLPIVCFDADIIASKDSSEFSREFQAPLLVFLETIGQIDIFGVDDAEKSADDVRLSKPNAVVHEIRIENWIYPPQTHTAFEGQMKHVAAEIVKGGAMLVMGGNWLHATLQNRNWECIYRNIRDTRLAKVSDLLSRFHDSYFLNVIIHLNNILTFFKKTSYKITLL